MTARREKPVTVTINQAYDLIVAPVVTEKSTMGSENNQVTFRVPLTATKPQIKAAIEILFKVKVNSVNTLKQRGKIKRFKGKLGKRPDYKKAIVSLAEGEMIDVTTGV
ncbi:MAG: 50S ribosomal protein L23 [Rhodospirillaceae bacterium]|nr:50S ribosomal protein L23 [Rhodospirillaceae bacterium]|tara:strand:+ start:94 stop:417 length:324 start_codon:yes stop_codon:yes gene_type:complete